MACDVYLIHSLIIVSVIRKKQMQEFEMVNMLNMAALSLMTPELNVQLCEV
jgi:hypothetical protein